MNQQQTKKGALKKSSIVGPNSRKRVKSENLGTTKNTKHRKKDRNK